MIKFVFIFLIFLFISFFFALNNYDCISIRLKHIKARTPGDTLILRVSMESSPKTLYFFVNGEQQKGFNTHIPDSVGYTVYFHLYLSLFLSYSNQTIVLILVNLSTPIHFSGKSKKGKSKTDGE